MASMERDCVECGYLLRRAEVKCADCGSTNIRTTPLEFPEPKYNEDDDYDYEEEDENEEEE